VIRDLFYLGLRLYVSGQWLRSALPKLRDPNWSNGEEVKRFLTRATAVPPPPARPPIAFGWYRSFLTKMMEGDRPRYLAQVIVVGQLVSGVGLLLPVQPRLAAAVGLLQNLTFSLAGSSGHNPTMLLAQQHLIVTGDEVGRIGLQSGRRRRQSPEG
jgi:thiosulfate dehydrogenase [quinone] large subunit